MKTILLSQSSRLLGSTALRACALSLAILASSITAVAEPIVVPAEAFTTPEIAAAIAKKCDPDCLVLDRKDWTEILAKIKEAIDAAKAKNI